MTLDASADADVRCVYHLNRFLNVVKCNRTYHVCKHVSVSITSQYFYFTITSTHTYGLPCFFPSSAADCDAQCGQAGGELVAEDGRCARCQCRCPPFDQNSCVRICQNRGGRWIERITPSGCSICECQCFGLIFHTWFKLYFKQLWVLNIVLHNILPKAREVFG